MQPHTDSAMRRTWGDFVALPEDDPRELIDGRLLEIDVSTALHEWIVALVVYHLQGWALGSGRGLVVGSGYKVFVDEHRGVMPDVQFYKKGRELPAEGLKGEAPDLVVEVISPSSGRYDRVEKLNWYAEIGVPEYWLIDPQQHTVQRLVLGDGGYRVESALAEDAIFAPQSFDGLKISLAQLWELPT